MWPALPVHYRPAPADPGTWPDAGSVEVRQGVTVWSVAVRETGDPAERTQAERLARIIAPELA